VNLQVLKTLQASVTATATTTHRANPDGTGLADTVMITNTSAAPTIGFVLRADVRRDTAAGTELAGTTSCSPRSGSDNEITLWPGESQTLTATCSPADLATPVISVSGWNRPKTGTGTGTVTCPAREQQACLPQCDGAEVAPQQ
jgi:exo-1,4-beta-D-glucosaminidase